MVNDSSAHAFTQAKINFFVTPTDGSVPRYINKPDLAPDEPVKNFGEETKLITVENLRGKEHSVTLDTAGFQFFRGTTKVKDFSDDEVIKTKYYPESIEYLKKFTGANRALIFDHTVRRRIPGEDGSAQTKRQPSVNAHADQSAAAAEHRVRRHLPADEVPGLLSKRYQVINLWRPITHAADDWPLALCDFRSVKDDLDNVVAPVKLVNPTFEGELLLIKHTPEQKWKYLKGMGIDEFVLIKCSDSLDNGSVALFTPHTAFEDPHTPVGAPKRESIELRALVFYDY